ncbi:hypothetical protein COO91_02264 [Nostoc flagelliforme CCNUN1]|uniref:Uncharacterized protein n=1 Tax=Nostoc flagelliforme CCNUN1 TaxID=2038116 RepID=A0A2K8SLN1_9NOSO|nr:hypothetical protein COO91_02264 [Nostoc flagelliforme CCNUN1]
MCKQRIASFSLVWLLPKSAIAYPPEAMSTTGYAYANIYPL